MESQEVHWHVRSQVIIKPAAQLPRLIEIIPNLRDDEVSDLDVRLASVPDLLNRLENRLRIWYSDMLSDKARLRASFEIDCYAVEKIIHHSNSVRCIESVGDEDVDEPILTCLNPNVVGELHKDRRLVVSVSNPMTTMAQRQAHHIRRHQVCSLHLPPLANVMILAVATVVKDYAISNIVVVGDTFEAVYRLNVLGRLCALHFDPCSLV